MQSQDPYQPPQTDQNKEAATNETVRLWMPQATIMAEQGKSETTIRLFFKNKEVEERFLEAAVRLACDKGLSDKQKGNRPYLIVGWAFILIPGLWLAYLLIFHSSLSLLPLLPIAVGYGLINGSYLRDKK